MIALQVLFDKMMLCPVFAPGLDKGVNDALGLRIRQMRIGAFCAFIIFPCVMRQALMTKRKLHVELCGL